MKLISSSLIKLFQENIPLFISLDTCDSSFEKSKGFLFQLIDLLFHSSEIFLAFLVELLVGELETIIWMGEPGEEKSKDGVGEEALLSLFAILIHCVSHKREIYGVVWDKGVIFVVSMRVHYHSEESNELLLSSWWQLDKYLFEVLNCERLHQVGHGILLLLIYPDLLEWLEL